MPAGQRSSSQSNNPSLPTDLGLHFCKKDPSSLFPLLQYTAKLLLQKEKGMSNQPHRYRIVLDYIEPWLDEQGKEARSRWSCMSIWNHAG